MAYSISADTPAVNPCLHLRLKEKNRSSGRIPSAKSPGQLRWHGVCSMWQGSRTHELWTLSAWARPAQWPHQLTRQWTGEMPYGSAPRWRAGGGQVLMREQERVCSRKELPQLFSSKWSALHMCTCDQIEGDSGGYVHTCVHILYICNKIIQ